MSTIFNTQLQKHKCAEVPKDSVPPLCTSINQKIYLYLACFNEFQHNNFKQINVYIFHLSPYFFSSLEMQNSHGTQKSTYICQYYAMVTKNRNNVLLFRIPLWMFPNTILINCTQHYSVGQSLIQFGNIIFIIKTSLNKLISTYATKTDTSLDCGIGQIVIGERLND